jgi:hypothetical protein
MLYNPSMPPLLTFDEAYPDVQNIWLQEKADETRNPKDEYKSAWSLREHWPYEGPRVRCRYPSCHASYDRRGYFDLTEMIQKMLQDGTAVCEISLVCNGYKGKPARPPRHKMLPLCGNRRKFRLTIERKK